MTNLLEQALEKVHQLAPEQQDGIAVLILEALADEAQWEQTFATSQDTLALLAAQVRKEKLQGKVHQKGFDDL